MRQLLSFLDCIHMRNTKTEYYRMQFHASLKGAQIKPLEEILGVSSKESEFDDSTAAALERRALQLLAEQKRIQNV